MNVALRPMVSCPFLHQWTLKIYEINLWCLPHWIMWSVSSTWKNALYMLLLLLSRFSRVRLCATPEMAAHRAPLSLGFSRQEHWSVLPFPSPVHEIEKWKWSRSVVFNSSQPHGLQPTRLLCPWDFPGKSTGAGCHRLLRLIHSRCLITNINSY